MAMSGVQSKIQELRRALRALALQAGLARVFLIAVGLAALCLLLDWTFHLAPEWRLALGAGVIGTLGWAVWRFLIQPMTVPMPDDQIALLFERRFPDLSDRMVSAVQLANDSGLASSGLVRAVLADADEAAMSADAQQVPRRRKIGRMALWAVASAALAIALCLAAPQSASIFAARFANPYGPAQWPRDTDLAITVAGSDKSVVPVPKGEQIAVIVQARNVRGRPMWKPPRTVWLDYQFASGRRESRQMRRVEGNAYQAYFNDVLEDLTLRARAGSTRTGRVDVQVVELPRVEDVWLSFTYPKYTGLAPEPPSASLTEIRAIEGTRVKVEIRANRKLKADGAEILIDPTGPVRMHANGDGGTTGATHAGELVLAKGMRRFRIQFTDESGLQNRHPRTFELYVIEDKPPQVKLVKPGGHTRCTRYAIVPLEARLKDDHALRGTWIRFRTGPKEQAQTAPLKLAVPRARAATVSHRWDMSELGVKVGQTISYRIEADDFRDVFPAGSRLTRQIGRSDEYYIRIVSSADLASELDRQLFALRKEVKKTKVRQEQDRRNIEELLRKTSEGQPLTNDDRSAAADSENIQRELGRTIERVAERVGQIRDRMRDNRIGSFADGRRLDDIQATLKDVAASNVPRAANFIKDARKDLAAREGRDSLQNAASVQGDIIRRLDGVLASMSHNEDIDNLVRAARELLRRQRAVKDDVGEFSKRPDVLAAPVKDLKPADRAALNLLVRRQNAARDDMRNLEQHMLNVFERLKEDDPKRAELVRLAQVQASRDQIRPMMETAAAKLADNNLGLGATHQQSAIKGLERLLEMLENARQESGSDQVLAQVIADVKNALADVRRLHEKQKGHASDTSEINKNARQAQTLKKLRRDTNRLRTDQDKTTDRAKDKSKLGPLADEQDKLGKQADGLADRLEKEATDAGTRRAPQASDIDKATKAVKSAKSSMDTAKRQMAKGAAPDAAKSGKKASDKLGEADRHIAAALDKIEKKRLADTRETALKQGDTAREAERVMRKLEQLSKENENTSKEASQGLGKAGKKVDDAKGSMKAAQSGLDRNDTVQGEKDAEKARDELAEAQRMLEKLRNKLEEKQKEQKILDLIVELQPMLDRQIKINIETARIDNETAKAKLKEPTRPDKVRLGQLGADESGLANKAAELLKKVEGENAPVFAWGVKRLEKDMNEVKDRLVAFQTDSYTQDVERDIADTLRMLIDALKREQSRMRKGGGGSSGGGGGGGKPMLVPPSAQLKLLKARELEIHNDTKRLELKRLLRPDRRLGVLQKKRIGRLGREQAELSTLTKNLAEALEREVEERMKQQREENE
jgi:uncharacterized protein DUF4175